MNEFCSGSEYFFDHRNLFYNAVEVIDRAITSWREGKEYSWLLHNCQHFVNKITSDQDYSEAINEISEGALIAGGLVSIYGLFSGSKTALNAGLTIGGLGVAGKTLNGSRY